MGGWSFLWGAIVYLFIPLKNKVFFFIRTGSFCLSGAFSDLLPFESVKIVKIEFLLLRKYLHKKLAGKRSLVNSRNTVILRRQKLKMVSSTTKKKIDNSKYIPTYPNAWHKSVQTADQLNLSLKCAQTCIVYDLCKNISHWWTTIAK